MNTSELQHYCSQFPGAEHQLVGPPGNVLVYGVGDKQFAYFKLSDPEKWRFSIRTTPERFLELTDMPGIKPARYLGRFHWVTIVDVRSMPPDYLQELVSWSYNKALASLSKTRQAQLLRPSA
ncbi:MmcQ/YjbR family DNA-binding protein [Chitinimonas viridis]|uniref:MmcQ/YjbR family DNA-binding protein n=1 Tax=Chitinimonas viridis TaxID=664880 RepID=A0ABT8AZF4_9NEIS|nr:MmcQ/YjbR family DNA-binding protein [Chitinimonas viridis]MDN3575362.1 MmcQ/YjbR family DNA-binding protein [Chitinimonas viridis]